MENPYHLSTQVSELVSEWAKNIPVQWRASLDETTAILFLRVLYWGHRVEYEDQGGQH